MRILLLTIFTLMPSKISAAPLQLSCPEAAGAAQSSICAANHGLCIPNCRSAAHNSEELSVCAGRCFEAMAECCGVDWRDVMVERRNGVRFRYGDGLE